MDSNKDKEKKNTDTAKFSYLIFYYFFLAYLSFALIFVYLCGELSFLVFVYGKISVYLLFGCLAILWALPVVLRKRRRAVMLGVLTLLLAAYCFVPGKIFGVKAREQYADFSYEEWSTYPVVRTVMYEALKDRDSIAYIIGKTAEQAKTMLGEPDYEDSSVIKYNTTPSPGAIELELKDDIVTDVDYPLFF